MQIDASEMEWMRSSATPFEPGRQSVTTAPPCDMGCEFRTRCHRTGETCKQMDHWLSTEQVDHALSRDPDNPDTVPPRDGRPLTSRERLQDALDQWPPGYTMGQIASRLGVSQKTLYTYRRRSTSYPSEAIIERAWEVVKSGGFDVEEGS